MTIVATWEFVKTTLDNLAWPTAMSNLPALNAYILPPDPNIQTAQPVAYVWGGLGDESRRADTGGANPRIQVAGGPSGSKGVVHTVFIYMFWQMQASDPSVDPSGNPDTDTLFPGMVDAVKWALRLVTLPKLITDPWTGEVSQLQDVGEIMRHQIFVRDSAPQSMKRYDAFIECSINEIFHA